MTRYYLDTSAHMERRGGLSETRARLRQMLRGERHATSTQVEREWNRIVFDTCVTLRNALANAKDRTDVVKIMTKGWGRTAARHWQVENWIMGRKQNDDLAVVAKRAADFQRIRARAFFRAGIDTIRDGTECAVAKRRPERGDGGWHYSGNCKQEEHICQQREFFSANRERARAAATALEASPRKHDRWMGKNANEWLADGAEPNATTGRACWGDKGIGGDICIALECGTDETLLTTDESFDLICPAVDISHQRL